MLGYCHSPSTGAFNKGIDMGEKPGIQWLLQQRGSGFMQAAGCVDM